MNKEKTTNGAGTSPRGEPVEHWRTRPPSGAREGAHGRVLLVGGYKGLSGNAYVVAEPGADGTGADGEPAPGPARAAIPIRTPGRCGHGETICRECAGTWVTAGWALHFGRTAGGRRLRDELGGEALAEMAARRAAGLDPAAVRAHQAMADAVRAGERDRAPYRARPVRPAVAGDGASPYQRDLKEGNQGRSGKAYVVAELDTSHRDADGKWIPGLERVPVRIRTPRRCDHRETVCVECAESWMFDWVFYFDRTAGGRRLRAGLGGDEALAAVARRRADWGSQHWSARDGAGKSGRTRHPRQGGSPVKAGRDPAAQPGAARGSRPPGLPDGTGGEQHPIEPVYLSGVLTVQAELSAGRLYGGSTHQENASPVLAALVFIGGTAMLFTEDENGQITRLRIPGPGFLRLTDDSAGKLARSRPQPDKPGEPGDPSPASPGKEPDRP